jgi:hypothetical protein
VSSSAAVLVRWSNGPGTEIYESDGTSLLTAGSAADYDGAIVELGYYTGALVGAPFLGSWVHLLGNRPQSGTIGDLTGLPDGRFSLSDLFAHDQGNALPIGTPLSIRFYDSTSIATSTYFNAVSTADGKIRWPQSPDGTVIFDLDDLNDIDDILIWQGGVDSAFRTTIPVPEPGTVMLGMAQLMAVTWWRHRRRHDQ